MLQTLANMNANKLFLTRAQHRGTGTGRGRVSADETAKRLIALSSASADVSCTSLSAPTTSQPAGCESKRGCCVTWKSFCVRRRVHLRMSRADGRLELRRDLRASCCVFWLYSTPRWHCTWQALQKFGTCRRRDETSTTRTFG